MMSYLRFIFSSALTARLTRRTLAIVIASFVLLLAILRVEYAMERDSLRDRALVAQASDIAAYVTIGEDGLPAVDLPQALADAYIRPDRQYVYFLLDDAGHVLASSPGFEGALAPLPAGRRETYFNRMDVSGRGTYYGVTVPLAKSHPPLYLQVAQGSIHRDALADSFVVEFLEQSWVFLLVLAAGITAVTVMTVRQSLAPLTRLSIAARSIGPGSLDRRLPEESLPDEIRPLVRAVNTALRSIEHGYRREREFTANAAHELRTPLAVLKANIETLSSLEDVPELVEELDGIERLVTQLLRLAQADSLVLRPGERADLREVALGVARQLAPKAVAEGKSIELSGAEGAIPVRGNADFLALALRNLVENALAHTPRGKSVEIRLGADTSITVIDEGPGVALADAAHIFGRFVRMKPEAYRGAGLGLSIAARVAAVHDGHIQAGREPGRGAAFTLRLPKSAVPAPRQPGRKSSP